MTNNNPTVLSAAPEEALRFVESAFRNIDLPSLSREDLNDIACSLSEFARHRQLSIASLTGDVGMLREALTLAADELDYVIPFLSAAVKRSAKERRDAIRAALTPSPLTDAPDAPDAVREAGLRLIVKGWLDWYRFATRDDECEYLNGKGWEDAEALASTSMGELAALTTPPAKDDAGRLRERGE